MNQNARQDDNEIFALIGHSGTAGTAETRKVVVTDGAIHANVTGGTIAMRGDYPVSSFNSIAVAYPSGSVETYTYSQGTAPVGTITVTYTGTAKTDLSSVSYA